MVKVVTPHNLATILVVRTRIVNHASTKTSHVIVVLGHVIVGTDRVAHQGLLHVKGGKNGAQV